MKNSELLDSYGMHTLEMHFRNTNSLQKDEIPSDFSGLDNIGNTCYINAIL
jgi:ubiquitin C-terminal hydrolase